MTSRKTVMRLLALAPAPLLESALQKDLPAVRARGCKLIRKPETGLIMARGRISGTGSPFNVGDVTRPLAPAVIQAMQKAVEEKRAARVKRAAGTRVNFFTMVRGED